MESTSLWQKKHIQFLIALALIAGVFALTAFGLSALKQAKYWMNGPVTVNVVGEGEIKAVPDIGTFTFGVRGEGADATTAQNMSAEDINTISDFLRDSGVEDKDIETSNYNLNPKYRWEQRVCLPGTFCGGGEQIADGFEVYQTITVKVRNLDQSGALISGVGERGATDISGLSFTIDDTDVLKDQARKEAIEDARAKAKLLADQLGVRLGKMVSYYEDEGGYMPMMYDSYSKEMGMGGDTMSIEPAMPVGEESVKVKVNITYEVK